jgi:hypothetical protein
MPTWAMALCFVAGMLVLIVPARLRSTPHATRARVRARVRVVAEDLAVEKASEELRPAFGLPPTSAPRRAETERGPDPATDLPGGDIPGPRAASGTPERRDLEPWPAHIAVCMDTSNVDYLAFLHERGQPLPNNTSGWRTICLSPPGPEVIAMERDRGLLRVLLLDGTEHVVATR